MLVNHLTYSLVLLYFGHVPCASESDDVESQLIELRDEDERLERKLDQISGHMSKIYKALMLSRGTQLKTGVVESSDDIVASLNTIPLEDLISLLRGRDGYPGQDGAPGPQGVPGDRGEAGRPGYNGTDGQPGERGMKSSTGPSGDKGVIGSKGEPGARGQTGGRGQKGSAAASGSVYTRWGHKSCGPHSSILYEGFAAGGGYSHTGGGVDYQCMPVDPQFESNSLSGGFVSWLYGTEYKIFRYASNIPPAARNQHVPCARCYSSGSAVMMLPARRDCPAGWNREYHGYLMSAYYDHVHPATYECVDSSPQYITGGDDDTNGALFYFVKPDCSGAGTVAHCPPYSSDKAILCAVCTK